MTGTLTFYRQVTKLLSPIVPLYLWNRARKGKEDKARVKERYGKTLAARPVGSLIWMHAASVGESVMLLPLIERFLKEDPAAHILITTGTVTSAQIMSRRLPPRAIHQYGPIDTPASVTRFLDHWTPDMAIWAESEIWPNLILETKYRDIPMALINARMSQSSLDRWNDRNKAAGQLLFGSFRTILPADSRTAKGLSDILDRDIPVTGNLKYAGKALDVDMGALAAHRAVIGTRPVWTAASTHEGEDEIVLTAHKEIMKSRPDAMLILVPRHPERGRKITRLIEETGLDYTESAFAEDITDMTNVILIAAMGKLGLAYRLSSTALVAGSLIEGLSGHNPLEPARLNAAILSGPYVASFADVFAQLGKAGGMQTVTDANSIAQRVLEYWTDDTICTSQAKRAADFAASQDTVLDKVWNALSAI